MRGGSPPSSSPLPQPPLVFYWPAVLAIFTFPALGGFLFGYDIGSTSFVLSQLTENGGPHAGVSWAHLITKNHLRGFFTASGPGGAFLGSILVFRFGERLGRRRELLIASLLYVIGGLLEASSSMQSLGDLGLVVMMVGRWLYGIGCGFAMHGAPAYIAEMSPPSIRGAMVSMKEAAIVVGILAGYAIGIAYENIDGGWRWTYGLSVPIAVFMGFGNYRLPRSARWLALNRRFDEAARSLSFFLDYHGVERSMIEIREQCDEYWSRPKRSVFSKKFSWPLIVGVGAVTFQQITGQPSVLYYATEIFNTFQSPKLVDDATLILAGFKVAVTFAAVLFVDRFGRRRLLTTGVSLMFVALLILCGTFYHYDPSTSSGLDSKKLLILLAMLGYIGGYQVGFGPVSWLLISEVFPLEVRGQAVALSVQANFLWNMIVAWIFPALEEAWGSSATFGIFAFICLLSLAFVVFVVPETKGLSLEEIEAVFEKRKVWMRPSSSNSLVPPRIAEEGGLQEPLLAPPGGRGV